MEPSGYTKIVETFLRDRIHQLMKVQHNKIQRGFTRHSSHMNCSLILEETIWEYKDLWKPLYIAFLDANSAFDVVSHETLLRKHFSCRDSWSTMVLVPFPSSGCRVCGQVERHLLRTFPDNAGHTSEWHLEYWPLQVIREWSPITFRQTLHWMSHWWAILCSINLLRWRSNKSRQEKGPSVACGYRSWLQLPRKLQPVKSVVLQIRLNANQMVEEDLAVTINGMPMPAVQEVMHIGILRSAIDISKYHLMNTFPIES